MKWPFLFLIPLTVYLLNTGAELLTVALVLAIAAVAIQVVSDNLPPRRRRERTWSSNRRLLGISLPNIPAKQTGPAQSCAGPRSVAQNGPIPWPEAVIVGSRRSFLLSFDALLVRRRDPASFQVEEWDLAEAIDRTEHRRTEEDEMKWLPYLMLLPLGVYLLAQGLELLTIVLILAASSVLVLAIGDRFQPRSD
jgi:hypothetical protein